MRLSLLLLALALAPALVAARWRPSAARASLFAAPALFVVLALGVYGAEVLHLVRGIAPAHRLMRLFARLFYGLGLGFPALGIVVGVARLRAGATRAGLALVLACALPVACSTWALGIEPRLLEVRRLTVVSPRAPSRPLTVLHVSDLQTDGACRRERLAEDFAARAEPDLVLFTGDLMNADDPDRTPELVRATHAFLASLHARLGVFGVLGDWDGWGDDWPEVLAAVTAGTSMRILRNETVTLEVGDGTTVTVHGMYEDDAREGRTEHTARKAGVDLPRVARASGLRIVMAHSPDVVAFDTPVPEGGADLLVAGHTHGGQIVLPVVGALTTHTRLGFAGGRTEVRGMPLVVSRGIGMRGGGAPRVRLGCRPEIGLIEIARDPR